MSIGLSTHLLEADFSGTAFGGTFVPTDITRFWRLATDVQVTSWRQDEQSDVAPSTFTIQLDNADLPGDATAPNAGRFTPGLSTSPWFPRILPAVRLRISETVGGTTYKIVDGFALAWTADYDDDGAFTTCTVTCVDILGWMGTLQALRSIYLEECMVDHPLALYPLEEPSGSTSVASIAGVWPAGRLVNSKYGAGTVTFGNSSFPLGDGAVKIVPASSGSGVGGDARSSWLEVGNPIPSSAAFSVEAWFARDGTIADEAVFSAAHSQANGGVDSIVQIGVRTDGQIFWNLHGRLGGSANVGVGGVGLVSDTRWHHVAMTLATDLTTIKVYFDGALLDSASASFAVDLWVGLTAPTIPLIIGGSGGYGSPKIDEPFHGSIAAVAVYPAELTAADVLRHYTAGQTGFAGESTDAHLTRLLRYRPNLGSVLDAGKGTVSLHATSGQSMQQALLDTAKAEGGLLYVDGQGRIIFLNRAHLYNPASSATFDTATDLNADYTATVDVQRLANDVTIARPNGSQQRLVDATSQATYGVRAVSDTLLLTDDRAAADAAGWRLANSKAVNVRTPTCTVDCISGKTTSQAQAALARSPLDRITLSNLPSSAPPTDVTIQGRTVTIGMDKLDVSFFTAPLPRGTLRCDAAPSSTTKLDNGSVIAW